MESQAIYVVLDQRNKKKGLLDFFIEIYLKHFILLGANDNIIFEFDND